VELAVKNGLVGAHEVEPVLAACGPGRDAGAVLLERGVQQRHLDSLKKKVQKQQETREKQRAEATQIQPGDETNPGGPASTASSSGSSKSPTHAATGTPIPELDPRLAGVVLFGQIALKHGLLKQEDLDLALGRQVELEKMGVKRRLGEIFKDKGILDSEKVQKVLAYQEKFIFGCPTCGQRWNVHGSASPMALRCPQDKVVLQPIGTIQSIGVQGSLRGVGASGTPPALPRSSVTVSSQSGTIRKPSTEQDPAGLLGIEWKGHKIEKVLGRGGMGAVYLATQMSVGRKVALKVILRGAAARKEERERFVREARDALAKLGKNNPMRTNIVQVFLAEHDEKAELAWFTMEYVPGRSFKEALSSGAFPMDRGARIVATLARAIHVAHERGIIHRDLKPQNIMLDESEDKEHPVPKILDFGLAKTIDQDTLRQLEQLTQMGAFLGTPSYMAPEQAGGDPNAVDGRADVYALGAMLYEVMTGRPPFRSRSPVETIKMVLSQEPERPTKVFPGTIAALEGPCLKALHKNPDERQESAQKLAEEIEAALGPEKAAPVRATAPPSDGKPGDGSSSKGLFGRFFGS
jgi:hypothetical protein